MTIKKLDTTIKDSLITLMFFSIFAINQCYAEVSVGDSYGGGTVFCVSQTPDITKCVPQGSGNYGLIMANEDQVNFDSSSKHGVTWASERLETKALSDDDGKVNTAAIIAAHPKDNLSNNAAWLCHNYRGGGKEGWYLPSKDELNKMYLFAKTNNLIGRNCVGRKDGGVQCLLGGWKEEHNVYWSSTEFLGNSSLAWTQNFSYGNTHGNVKVKYDFGVRAVRAFINSTIQQFNNLLLKHPVAVALAVMAENPNSDPESLKFVFGHTDIDANGLAALARHRNVDVDLLRGIAGHPVSDAPTLLAVARNPIIDVAGLRAIINHRNVNPDILTAVAAHPHADADILLAIAQNPVTDDDGLNAVLHHPNVNARIREIIASRLAAAAPLHTSTDRFTFGTVGDKLARLGNLTQLYPPNYQPPALVQAMNDVGIPSPQEVSEHCDDVAACAVANGAVNCTRLTREDAAAIAMYTFDFGGSDGDRNPYRLINSGLFERNTLQLRKLRGLLHRLLHALRSLQPVQPPALFRGIRTRVNLNDTHYHRGNKITWHTFSSTTTDMETTQLFLTDQDTGKCEGTLFIIRGTPWGYNIQPFSCFPEEREILLEPEIDFRVTGVINAPLIVVDLEMLPDQKLLLESLIPRNIGAVVSGSPSAVSPVAASPVQYKRFIALADWESTITGGLSFKKGDIIKILDDKNEWWKGELNGERGWVPPGYLKPNSPAPAPQTF